MDSNDESASSAEPRRFRSFGQNTLIVMATSLGSLVMRACVVVLIGRQLGAVGQGIFSLTQASVAIAAMMGSLGIEAAIVHFVGQKKANLKEIAGNSLSIALIMGILIGVFFLIGSQAGLFKTAKTDINEFLAIACAAPLLVLMHSTISRVLLGQYRVGTFSLLGIAQTSSLLIMTLLFLSTTRLEERGPVLAYVLSTAVVFLISLTISLRYKTFSPPRLDKQVAKGMIGYGLKAYWGTLMQFLNYRLDAFIVAYFWGEAQVGYYAVAVMAGEAIWYLPNAVSIVLLSKTALSSQDIANQVTACVSRCALLLTSIACVILAVVGTLLIPIVWPHDFVASILPLYLLLPGTLCFGVCKIFANDLAGRGFPQYMSWSAGVALVVTVTLDFILIPRWGIAGAAVASSAAYILSTLLMLRFFCRVTKLSPQEILFIRRSDFGLLLNQLKRRKPVGTNP